MAAKNDKVKNAMSTGMVVASVAIVILIFVVILIASVIGMYNSIVRLDTEVDNAWSKVEVVYQRRVDLIPNLVATVSGAKDFEQETLIRITEARSSWTNSRTPEERVAAANGMESALSRLMVVVESYPELKSNANFLALQDELANTENKIAVERMRYSEAVKALNIKLRVFPSNIVGGMFGFEQRTMFEASEGAEIAPVVAFE